MDILGASYVPLRLIGTQVVNGINYMFIAKETLSDKDKTTNIVLWVINIPAGDITGEKAEQVEVISEATLPPEVEDAFDAAIGQLTGVNYTPLLYIGHQVEKGLNYYVLWEATPVTLNAVPKPVVVCVNTFEGKNTVVSVEPVEAFDIGGGELKDSVLETPLGEWP
jgi:hypothetical protein